MRQFLDDLIATRTKYNLIALPSFSKRKKLHNLDLHSKITVYFDGTLRSAPYKKRRYFCSELVVDCLRAIGFIPTGPDILYQSDTFSPGDIAKDGTFGAFLGYLTSMPSRPIPQTDHFFHGSTFREIWPRHHTLTQQPGSP